MIFRQFEGLFPMPVYFEVGVPQNFAWTLLSRYITSCPSENKPLEWNVSVWSAVLFASFLPPEAYAFSQQIFPTLEVVNGPSGIDVGFQSEPYPSGGPG